MVSRVATFVLSSLLGLGVASGAMADRVRGHDQLNEVSRHSTIQWHRIAEEPWHGRIGRWGTARDFRRDEPVERRLSRDEARHDRHLMFAERRTMHRESEWTGIHRHDRRR